MARRFQIKVYSANEATLLGTIPDAQLFAGRNDRSLHADDTLTFSVVGTVAFLGLDRIARLVDTEDVWERSYRIAKINSIYDGVKPFLEIHCNGMWIDLSKRIHALGNSIIDQTPLTHITQILSGSGWTVGTVTPTENVTLDYDYNTVLFDLQTLAEKTGYNLSFTTTPGGAKTVSLISLGAATGETVEYAKNIMNIRNEWMAHEANKVYGIGSSSAEGVTADIGFATHRITAIDGNDITLDSAKVIFEHDVLNGFAIQTLGGDVIEIVDSIDGGAGFDVLTLDDATGLAVDDAIRIVTNDDPPQRVPYVHSQAFADLYTLKEIKVNDDSAEEIFNIVGPAEFSTLSSTYTGGVCDGWSEIGICTTTENTDAGYVINGTKSQKVVVPEYTATPSFDSIANSGDGVLTGDYQYKTSHITEGGEGPLSAATNISSSDNRVLVTFDSEVVLTVVTHRNLYRTKAGGSIFYRIATIPIDTLTFMDNIPDELLTIEPPATLTAAGGMGVLRVFNTVPDRQYAAVVYGFVDSGSVRAQFRNPTEAPPLAIPFPPPSQENRGTTPVASKTSFTITLEGFEANDVTASIEVVSNGGPATFYVDSVMVVDVPYAPNKDKFVADNSMTELWYKCHDELTSKTQLDNVVDASIADLHELNDSGIELNVGDFIGLDHSLLGLDFGIRIVRKSFNILDPKDADFELEVSSSETYRVRRSTDETLRSKRKEAALSSVVRRQANRMNERSRHEVFTSQRASVSIARIT